ncbi:membrane protein, partial [Metarhizium majus ARSEF 297]
MDTYAEDKEYPSITAEEDNAQDSGVSDAGKPILPRRRLATLYDAVAGRVTKDTALRNEISDQKNSHGHSHQRQERQRKVTRHSTRGTPIAPHEVLFRRKDAPERYAEHDVYNAHERDLPRGGRDILPHSDLLKSVHAYSSKFYGAMERRRNEMDRETEVGGGAIGGRSVDERSMDETALLAFGILLEEAGREVLGQRGDLVFTEGVVGADGSSGDEVAQRTESTVGYRVVESSLRTATNSSVAGGRLAKRRRLADSYD